MFRIFCIFSKNRGKTFVHNIATAIYETRLLKKPHIWWCVSNRKQAYPEHLRRYDAPLENNNSTSFDQLETMLNIQNKTQNMRERPIEIQGALTFALTLVSAVVQAAISILGILEP